MDKRSFLILGAAAGAGLAYGFWPRPDNSIAVLPGVNAANAQEAATIEDITLGNPDAPVTVVEYASYTCPHCADFHNDTFKEFKAQYIDTGKVHFIYREVFFDRYGLWASMVARCAGPDRYFGVADLIYQEQQNWARAGEPAQIADALQRLGLQAGLEQETLDACFQDGAMAQGLVNWYEANVQRDGVRSTPSFLINGDLHSGNMSLTQIGDLVDAAS